jgi:hypothetical protein
MSDDSVPRSLGAASPPQVIWHFCREGCCASAAEAAYKIATTTMVAMASTKPAVASTSRWTGVPQAARWHLALFGFHNLLPQVIEEVCGRRTPSALDGLDANGEVANGDADALALLARDVDEARLGRAAGGRGGRTNFRCDSPGRRVSTDTVTCLACTVFWLGCVGCVGRAFVVCPCQAANNPDHYRQVLGRRRSAYMHWTREPMSEFKCWSIVALNVTTSIVEAASVGAREGLQFLSGV